MNTISFLRASEIGYLGQVVQVDSYHVDGFRSRGEKTFAHWELYRKQDLVLDGIHVLCLHLGGRCDVFPRSGKDYYYILGDTGDATCSSDSLGPYFCW